MCYGKVLCRIWVCTPFDSIAFLTDYLEELFPEGVTLYPKDNLYKKYKQRILVETLGSAVSNCWYMYMLEISGILRIKTKKKSWNFQSSNNYIESSTIYRYSYTADLIFARFTQIGLVPSASEKCLLLNYKRSLICFLCSSTRSRTFLYCYWCLQRLVGI